MTKEGRNLRASVPLLILYSSFFTEPAPAAEPRLAVTVVDAAGAPMTGLKPENFLVFQDKKPCPVSRAEYRQDLVDVALLIDTSAYSGQGRREIERIAGLLVGQLSEKEQMAIISYATSADLVQDFTSSKSLLGRAAGALRYGNEALILDSIYAAVDAAFQRSAGRHVLLVLSTGADGRNRVSRKETLALAQRNGVSIFAISLSGYGRDPLEKLAEETAGGFHSGKELRQMDQLARNLFRAFRGHYELALGEPSDNPEGVLEGRVKVEVKLPQGEKEKLLVSWRALE